MKLNKIIKLTKKKKENIKIESSPEKKEIIEIKEVKNEIDDKEKKENIKSESPPKQKDNEEESNKIILKSNEDKNIFISNVEEDKNKEEYYKNIVRVKFDFGEGCLLKNKVKKYIIIKT